MAEQDPSIDDILAQARSADGGASATPAADDNGDVSESVPPTEKTPAAPAAEKVDPSSMSVADMLAAARGEGAAPAPKVKPKAKAKVAPKAAPKTKQALSLIHI